MTEKVIMTESDKKQFNELIESLKKLQIQMNVSSTHLHNCGYIQHSEELDGASDLVDGWIEGVINEVKEHA